MKIEIDTVRDSKDDIKKIIKMLMHLIEDHAAFDMGFAKANPDQKKDPYSSENNSLNLDFLDSGPKEDKEEEEKEPEVDFSSIIEY